MFAKSLAALPLAAVIIGCGTVDTEADIICSHNLSKEELRLIGAPTIDMKNGNVGMYTAGEGGDLPRFSLLNCKTAKFAQVRYGADISALKQFIDQAVAAGATKTVKGFLTPLKGFLVPQSLTRRQSEMKRHDMDALVANSTEAIGAVGFPKVMFLTTCHPLTNRGRPSNCLGRQCH